MQQDTAIYLTKAMESLLTAETESINGRYNSCANRYYYACFQAAITALLIEGIRPSGQWNHQFVQAQFVGVLRLSARFEARPKSFRSRPLCAFDGCVHFANHMPCAESA